MSAPTAARSPTSESSTTTHFDAGRPTFSRARLYIRGSGFFRVTSSPAMMTSSLERRSGPTTLLTTFSKPIGRRGIRFGDVAHRVGENGRGRGKRKLFLRNGVHRANAVVWGPVYLPAFVAAEQMPTAMDGSAIASSIKRNTPGRASAVSSTIFL